MSIATYKITITANDNTYTISEHLDGTNAEAYARLVQLEAQALNRGHRVESAEYERVSDWHTPEHVKMTNIVAEMARYTKASSVFVNVDYDAEGEEQILICEAGAYEPAFTLRYEDRDRFLAEAQRLADESGFDLDTGMEAAAKPYVESLA